MHKATITVVVCLGICTLMFITSQNYYHDIKIIHATQRAAYNDIQARYSAGLEDMRLLQSFSEPYQKLVNQGLIGNEHRLYWVETLRKIAEDLKLKKVTYRIDPQKIYSAEFLGDLGEISVFASQMILQLDLLHEGDLLYLIDTLNDRVPGSFHVNQCSLSRSQDKFIMHPSNTNLLADCEFTWFTLKTATNEDAL
jgi:hypothetical protein